MSFKATVKPQLKTTFAVVEVYDDGTGGSNEVARVCLEDGTHVVLKTMLAINPYHQRRKALTEATMALLDEGLGGARVVPELYAELFELTPAYVTAWGGENAEGHPRICQVVRSYAPDQPGDEWRGEMYAALGDLGAADRHCERVIASHPDAERISLLDFATINQDRSARNWVTDHGQRFYAIDNGMAWFHEYPENDNWRFGCAIEDVILQREPWQFISGVFTTSWAGRPISSPLLDSLRAFDERGFLKDIERVSRALGFPADMSCDWRFEGILRRWRWMTEHGRYPSADEYRAWHTGSELMTPPEIVASGGRVVWQAEWDRDIA